MKTESKTLLGIALIVAVIGVGFILSNNGSQPTVNEEILIRKDSHSTETGIYNYLVTLVEFGDYQCPACGFAEPTVERLLQEYTGKLKLVFRHFPLPQHQNALLAAQAAEAAGEQGKFWEMHQLLYKNQGSWSESNNALNLFTQMAESLGLNKEIFQASIQSQKFLSRVEGDKKDGETLNVNATPTFFINGQKFTGTMNYNSLKSAIEEELKKNGQT